MDELHRAASAAPSTMGASPRPFWPAFAAGIVSDLPPAYAGLTRDCSVAGSFAQLGAGLSRSAREIG